MKDSNFFVIFGWMINNLKLKGMERDAFAIIYGFSQDEITPYYGSLSYMSKAMGCAKSTVQKVLKSLEEKGMIQRIVETINNVTFNRFKALADDSYEYDETTNMVYRKSVPYTEKDTEGYRKSVGGIPKIGTNNIEDNIIDNIEEKDISSVPSDISKEKPRKRSSGVNPSLEEVQAFIEEKRLHVSAESIIRYYTNHGDHKVWRFKDGSLVKDWHRCIYTFEERWRERNKPRPDDYSDNILHPRSPEAREELRRSVEFMRSVGIDVDKELVDAAGL